MKNNKLFPVIIVVAFLAVAGIGYAIANSNSKSDESMKMSKDEGGNNAQQPSKSSDTAAKNTDTTPAAAANAVTIENYKFAPATMTIKVGTKVTWTNKDTVKHTVTVDSGDGPKSDLFGKGETFSYTFTKAGSYSYHCEPHPYMKATITVTE